MYFEGEPYEFHQVGKFYTHFLSDLDGVTAALIAGGYRVCKTLDGDMIIMAPNDYDDEDFNIVFHDMLGIDDDDDGDDGDDPDDPDDNIKHFPRNY